jgi:hypothetical protein
MFLLALQAKNNNNKYNTFLSLFIASIDVWNISNSTKKKKKEREERKRENEL